MYITHILGYQICKKHSREDLREVLISCWFRTTDSTWGPFPECSEPDTRIPSYHTQSHLGGGRSLPNIWRTNPQIMDVPSERNVQNEARRQANHLLPISCRPQLKDGCTTECGRVASLHVVPTPHRILPSFHEGQSERPHHARPETHHRRHEMLRDGRTVCNEVLEEEWMGTHAQQR